MAWSARLRHQFTTHSQKLAETGSHEHETTALPTSRRRGPGGRSDGARRGLRRGRRGGPTRRPAATDTTATSALKVGLVADAGQLNDNGFNELAFKGLKRAERELGITGRVVEAKTAADYIPNMSTLARQGFDLVIGVGFAQGDAIAATAKRFPNTSFAIVDVDQTSLKGKPTNVQGLLFREEQVGYLVGYRGRWQAKRAGGSSVSAVGGFKEPPVDRFSIAGYRAGALAAVPGTKVRWGYSQDWSTGPGEVQGAGAERDRRGVEGRLPGRGGLRAGCALRGEGRGRLGDRRRRRPVVPRAARPGLSALKGVDSAVFLTIKALQDGTFVGGKNIVFGIDQEGVGLGKLSPKANAKDVAAVEEVEQKLAAGEITGIPTTVK